MTPNSTIIISLPYPVKFLGIQFTRSRKIGFSFVNLSKMLFAHNNDLKGSKDYKEWVSANGESGLVFEQLYWCASAYCLLNKTSENFTKDGLKKALALADKETIDKILKVWKYSEYFGATFKESKKKAKP